ncbi:hypothetical protein FOL47_003682 [Perkinsus chesapeaki]|uniref:UBA domain-containing protein n=2 Tax=Alveolata TaxID=33630 RepID=A0A7J6M6Q3_PERCH|nr:hypothetical protein FOL47_003682 [Perkinsus chesapeaki]
MASDLILKLRTTLQTLRVRTTIDACQDLCQIHDYIEQAWPELKGTDYRVYYIDDDDEMCLLNDLSIGDALVLASERKPSSPTLDLFIKTDAPATTTTASKEQAQPEQKEQAQPEQKEQAQPEQKADEEAVEDTVADTLAQLLTDLEFMSTMDGAYRLVDTLLNAGQDLAVLTQEIQAQEQAERASSQKAGKPREKKVVQPVQQKQQAQVAKPKEVHIEKEVKSEKEAEDTMVDLLTQMGFVQKKEDAERFVRRLVKSGEDLQRVTDHILGIDEAKDEVPSKEAQKQLSKTDSDDVAREFVDILDNLGLVQNRDAAKELVGSLMEAEQDLDKISQSILKRSNSQKKTATTKSEKTNAKQASA